MAKRLESSIQGEVIHWALHHLGIECRKLEAAIGDPDTLVLVPRHPLLIEFKRGGASARVNQRIVHTRWRNAGYDVQVHSSAKAAKAAIRAALAAPLWAGGVGAHTATIAIEELARRVKKTPALLRPSSATCKKDLYGDEENY